MHLNTVTKSHGRQDTNIKRATVKEAWHGLQTRTPLCTSVLSTKAIRSECTLDRFGVVKRYFIILKACSGHKDVQLHCARSTQAAR